MWKKRKGYLFVFLVMLFLTSLIILSLSSGNVIGAKEPSERFKGYNKQRGKWTTGNLGKAYVEGDFVSYQLRIDKSSKVWGAPEFSISFNFHQRSSGAVYVDGFDTSEETGFQWSTEDFLPDGTETPPPGWGNHIPTPEAGEAWASGPKIINYMDAWPPGTGDGSPPGSYPAEERYFTVSGLQWTGDHIILFFRAHLALDIIWSEGLEKDLPKVLDGDEFEGWTNAWKGASFATGSSRHFYLRCPGVGKKDIPIPIAMYPSTVINGHKYVNDVPFNGWQINLTGELSLGPGLPPIPYTPASVYTGTSPWTPGYFEFTGLIEGSYTVQEEDRDGYTHEDILTKGYGTNEDKNIQEGWISFDLPGGGTHTVDFFNSAYEDLTVSKTVTPSWEQTFIWTIEKTATPTLSEIFVGDMADVKYTITVTATPTTNVYEVSGTITINNPNLATVEVYATILDEVWDGTVLKGSQDLTPGGPILIPWGVSTYDYSITLSEPVDVDKTYINRVTVEVTQPVSKTYFAEETFSFTEPTELVDEEVDVYDSYQGFLGTVHYSDSPKTFEYVRTFGPYSVVGSHTIVNTATATGKDTLTVWTDSATVEIDVFDIAVSKTVETYWERVFEWTVEKFVEAAQLQPFINDQIEVRYTITVVKTVATDTFNVSGTITIVNNNPSKSAEVQVIDKIYDGAIVVASKDLGTHTISPGGTLVLNYEITFVATPGKIYTNKVHVYLNNYHWNYMGQAIDSVIGVTEFTDSKTFTYTVPDEKINDEVTVTDVQTVPAGLTIVSSDYPTGGWVTSVDATFIINKVVKAVDVGTWLLKDEAYAAGDTETWSSGMKTLTFIVYEIDVSKTAEPWWERSFDWMINKSVSPTELILLKGETGTVTYTVTITKTVVGDQFKVNGTIIITNSNPEKSAVVHVVDKVYRPDGSVVASIDLGTHTIDPLATLELDYEITFEATPEVDYTNKVYVDLENYLWKLDAPKQYLYTTEFTGDANFTFTEPTKLVDNSATVEEVETVPSGFSTVVEWGPEGCPPWDVTESITIVFTKNITEVNAEICNWYDLPNTVTLTESDTGTVRQDSALVRIHVSEPPPPPENPPSFEFKHRTDVKKIRLGWTRTLTMEVTNTGLPQSRIYYLTFTAVIGNYSLLNFVGPPYIAHIKIYYNNGSIWEADVFGTITYEKFAGYDVLGDYWMVTWRVPTTYPDGPYLEGNFQGTLNAKVEISFQVTGIAQGETWLVFFPRATEDHHSMGVPLSGVADKANIWESDGFWYPVHNSYDPYDADIETGHAFVDLSWETLPTTNEYAWAKRWIYIVTKSI